MKKVLVLLFALLLLGSLAACDLIDSLPIPGGSDSSVPTVPPAPIFTPLPGFPELGLDPDSELDFEYTIVIDLPEITLIHHDLSGSDLLEPIMFQTFLGIDIAPVTIISAYDELVQENAFIFNDAWAIELYYFARRHENAVQSLIGSFEADVEGEWILPDSHLEISDLRTTKDQQTAFLAVTEELTNGMVRILLYMAQTVPDSNDVVVLDVVLFPHLWEAHDDVVLHELSQHIGLDLRTYLTPFVSQAAAEEI